jgi:filamentous hemagglutinin family protein
MAMAQISGDDTLGTQVNGSAIAPCTGICTITNGATQGNNLFHSFRQFSLPNGDVADFVTAPTIQNVIVRVTGVGQPFISNINGTIQTSNPVNFFLLNPNGVVFGPGAALNIGGSFLASTANRMRFVDGVEFRTPDPAPLLTISVPNGLQFNNTPEAIQMEGSFLSAGNTDSFSDFVLVGGDVVLDGAIVRAPGQRVEFAGVNGNSTVDLRLNNDRLSLNLAAGTPLRDITLTNRSIVNTAATIGQGEVVVTGQNITVDGSFILTGIAFGINNAATNQAGDITINAADSLQLTQSSAIVNFVDPDAIGQGGNAHITASDLQIRDGSVVLASTSGNGNAGNVRVVANTITLDGTSPNGLFSSAIGNQVDPTGNGNAGDITIETNSLTITNGALVSASTFGNGNGGNVQVAANTITLDGTTTDGLFGSAIGSQVGFTATGDGGDVTVQTDSLIITDGALVSADTFGQGKAGTVRVTGKNIALDGTAPGGLFSSAISSGIGISGSGQGGDVIVEADSLTVTNGAKVSATTFGDGNAGTVQVTANTITLDGATPNSQFASQISSEVQSTGNGRGGDVIVEADSLTITNGANVSGATFGKGDGGNVWVTADTIVLDGTTPNGQFISGIDSQVGEAAIGNGGNVTVQAGSLTITNGAGLDANTLGNGDGGDLQVTADTITLDGAAPGSGFTSFIGSQVQPTGSGQGGDIRVEADSITITNGANISSSALGSGSAGNLDITADTLRLDRGIIAAIALSGNGANINLTIGDLLLLRNGSEISTSAGISGAGGNGGNITIDASRGFLVTAPNENNDITANAFNGSGGNVTINTQGIFWFTPRSRAELAQLLNTNDPAQLDPRRLPTNDITAISQGNPNFNGNVAVNILNIDPSQGLVALPVTPTDPSQQIEQGCAPGSKTAASSFVATGRGGIPLSPDELLESRAVVTRWVLLPEEREERGSEGEEERGERGSDGEGREVQNSKSKIQIPIIEAQRWIVGTDGRVELITNTSTINSVNDRIAAYSCQTRS